MTPIRLSPSDPGTHLIRRFETVLLKHLALLALLICHTSSQDDVTVPIHRNPYGIVANSADVATFHINAPLYHKNMVFHPVLPKSETKYFPPPEISVPHRLTTSNAHLVKRQLFGLPSKSSQDRFYQSSLSHVSRANGVILHTTRRPEHAHGISLQEQIIQAPPLWVTHSHSGTKMKFIINNLGQSEQVIQQFRRGSNGGAPYVIPSNEESTTKSFESDEFKKIAQKIIKEELNKAKIAKFGKSSGKVEENSSGRATNGLEFSGYTGGGEEAVGVLSYFVTSVQVLTN
uniref:Protein TIFY 6B-like n=1 Tax=Heterorhabditis bacteriophora TaxID=37862 RepID=A0A1I7X9Y0_HETBA